LSPDTKRSEIPVVFLLLLQLGERVLCVDLHDVNEAFAPFFLVILSNSPKITTGFFASAANYDE